MICAIIVCMKEIILASRSPRRRELLEKCGIEFTCIPADIDESIDEQGDLAEEIRKLSMRKADAILQEYPDAIVIGSDTIVVCEGKVLGKPANEKDAAEMLGMLSGNTHQVYTGLCIKSRQKTYSTCSVSEVKFVPMTDNDIREYIATGECSDKAGAYAIQGYGGRYIEEIRGDYYAIMGLPLHQVYAEMKNRTAY